jgi:hypothetical protein
MRTNVGPFLAGHQLSRDSPPSWPRLARGLHQRLAEVEMKQLAYSLFAVIAACGLVQAQALEKKTETKVSVQDGRSITVTGCVERNADGGYTLTNAANKDGALGSYLLASDDDDLKDHVGHRVEITGKAADQGKGKIKVETKNERQNADGDKSKTTSTSEVKGDLKGLPFLGVKSVKMIASVCP